MKTYRVRITNKGFVSATITVRAENKEDAQKQALYGRPSFYVQWIKVKKAQVC